MQVKQFSNHCKTKEEEEELFIDSLAWSKLVFSEFWLASEGPESYKGRILNFEKR